MKIEALVSGNRKNLVYFINMPVQSQWPFYYAFDRTADNTFGEIPAELAGAGWISTKRLSLEENKTKLSFRVKKGMTATVYIMATGKEMPGFVKKTRFKPTGITGKWRDHFFRNDGANDPAFFRFACPIGYISTFD